MTNRIHLLADKTPKRSPEHQILKTIADELDRMDRRIDELDGIVRDLAGLRRALSPDPAADFEAELAGMLAAIG